MITCYGIILIVAVGGATSREQFWNVGSARRPSSMSSCFGRVLVNSRFKLVKYSYSPRKWYETHMYVLVYCLFGAWSLGLNEGVVTRQQCLMCIKIMSTNHDRELKIYAKNLILVLWFFLCCNWIDSLKWSNRCQYHGIFYGLLATCIIPYRCDTG